MFYLAGTSIAFFIAIILFSKKNKNLADKIMAIWLLVMGIHLFFYYTSISQILFANPWLLGIHLPFPLLHGPFLFLYTSAQTGQLLKWNKKVALHFLPILLNYLYLVPFFLLPSTQKIYVFQHKGVGYETYQVVNSLAIVFSGLIYVVLTSLLLRRHSKNILNQFSSTEKVNLKWIQYLIYGISIIWILVVNGNDDLVFSAAVLFVLFIGYYGIRQVGIFSFSPNLQPADSLLLVDSPDLPTIQTEIIQEREPELEMPGEVKKKYSKSGLTKEDAMRLHKELKNAMFSEKLYVQSDLTLTQLAKKLGTHPNYLSQVINHFEEKNFYDYINTLRVTDLKDKLVMLDNKKYTLLSLAFESGFNSKSTFNKYFKKVTGQSPTEYLEKNKASK